MPFNGRNALDLPANRERLFRSKGKTTVASRRHASLLQQISVLGWNGSVLPLSKRNATAVSRTARSRLLDRYPKLNNGFETSVVDLKIIALQGSSEVARHADWNQIWTAGCFMRNG